MTGDFLGTLPFARKVFFAHAAKYSCEITAIVGGRLKSVFFLFRCATSEEEEEELALEEMTEEELDALFRQEEEQLEEAAARIIEN